MKAKYSNNWGSIYGIIRKLENLMRQYNIKLAYVDGKKVFEIADDLKMVKKKELLYCL